VTTPDAGSAHLRIVLRLYGQNKNALPLPECQTVRQRPTKPPSRFGEFRDWHLNIHCGRCGRPFIRPVSVFAGRYGHTTPTFRTVARMRCGDINRLGEVCRQARPRYSSEAKSEKNFNLLQEIIVLNDRVLIAD